MTNSYSVNLCQNLNFGTLLYTTRVTKKSEQESLNAKTADENQEIKKNNLKRKGETMEETCNNKKRKVDGAKMVTENNKLTNENGGEEKKNKTKETKKRKKEDTGDKESQAKKRKTEPKKKRRLECCQRILHRLRKRVKKDSKDVLRLMLKAERVSKDEKSVSSYCCVHMEKEYIVGATVLGKPCLVLLDSGASISVMVLSVAQRLGLVTGREKTVKHRVFTWLGLLELDVVRLEEVVVVLKGGVVVNTPMVVFPQQMEKLYSYKFIMSMSRLQEAEMYQKFCLDGSCRLFLRHPKRLMRRYEKGRRGKVFILTARTPGIEDPLTVLVNTGVDLTFCITKTGLDMVCSRTHQWTLPPGRVRLQIDGSTKTLRRIKFSNMTASFHSAVGRRLLHQWKALIDYVESTITFKINKEKFRLHLLSR
ncbi:hypothetical protein E2C01_022726 [Portunus trituberculatus]|uniref:Uncharacterized protein n=1 Tax=Portunus trituberculatus TaxID=210409 RepID=A0A5B7E7V6_PORTR|nr:hypothetical protein [Portunus trituberculatus]